MRELAGPIMLITVAIVALIVWARVDRWRQNRRWRAMNADVARKREINDDEIARARAGQRTSRNPVEGIT